MRDILLRYTVKVRLSFSNIILVCSTLFYNKQYSLSVPYLPFIYYIIKIIKNIDVSYNFIYEIEIVCFGRSDPAYL